MDQTLGTALDDVSDDNPRNKHNQMDAIIAIILINIEIKHLDHHFV